ncbi:hypothetical protein [Luteolibacter sp. LG18]|uniref:hypothetical protein n=1 Tax=Luteolibacter sp. LG18 TaxID=2819286 RepID=UPI002B2E27F3|nr:hypothetical protein llg_05830 [Luteolibacter sp. LG18]
MKSNLIKAVAVALVGLTVASCTTYYDAYGYPQQSVDPLAAAAIAGAAGYAIGHNNRPKYYYYGRPYWGPRPYYYYHHHHHPW